MIQTEDKKVKKKNKQVYSKVLFTFVTSTLRNVFSCETYNNLMKKIIETKENNKEVNAHL